MLSGASALTSTSVKPSGFFIMQNCYICKNENLVFEDIKFYTIWKCESCGNSGIKQNYPYCCNNQELVELRSETSNGKWQRRRGCKNCKSLVGTALPKGDDFNKLPYLKYEQQLVYQQIRSDAHDECRKYCNEYTQDFREYLQLKERLKYEKYLQTPQWKAKALIVKERDKYLCQMCLTAKATEVHHITYDRKYNELTSDLISVCHKCHSSIHNK